MAQKKRPIPSGVKDEVLREGHYRCAYCGERNHFKLTHHHIHADADGGATETMNLIALCFNCHNLVSDGIITEKQIRQLKRHQVILDLTQAGANALKVAHTRTGYVASTPYAVQHLVERGFLEHVETGMTTGPAGDEAEALACYKITSKGSRLVKAWLL